MFRVDGWHKKIQDLRFASRPWFCLGNKSTLIKVTIFSVCDKRDISINRIHVGKGEGKITISTTCK